MERRIREGRRRWSGDGGVERVRATKKRKKKDGESGEREMRGREWDSWSYQPVL